MVFGKHVCVWKMVHDKVACDKVVCAKDGVCSTKWSVTKLRVSVTVCEDGA